MPCPFPGMDPYIERPEIWPDFHDRFITYLCGTLQPLLRPRYAALTQDRLYVLEAERPIYPDVGLVRTGSRENGQRGIALLEPDAPEVFELWREEVREPLIHIIEPAAGNRIVTALEVLSPTNKAAGLGRELYVKKREEFWLGGVNLLEMDLLREGEATIRLSGEKLASLRPHHYLVAVTRRLPSRQEIYPIALQGRLPRLSIPLAMDDKDVILDLQPVFTRCWDEGPYPELLHYQGSPPGALLPADVSWCEKILQEAGFRKGIDGQG